MGTLDDKVAIVSGSGRGIGREVALKLASEGAAVVVNDLDSDPAEQTVADIKEAGGNAASCVGSVVEAGFADLFVKTAMESFGGLDIIVNNAGYTWDTVIQKMTDEQWDAILDVHLKAPFQVLRAAQPFIKANAIDYHRKVVNVSSVTRMTEATAGDDAFIVIDGRKIKVGISQRIADMASVTIPLGRPGRPAEAAGAVYVLCTQDTNFVSGQCLTVDAGEH
jgi:3-oxoacyl-[acyl-carrier protein] reductase